MPTPAAQCRAASSSTVAAEAVEPTPAKVHIRGQRFPVEPAPSNVPRKVLEKCNVEPPLLHRRDHPLCLLKERIASQFLYHAPPTGSSAPAAVIDRLHLKPFPLMDDLHPVVSVRENFDSLLVPRDHVSRSPSDTYYVNRDWVLRTHTSAHQTQLLARGGSAFLVAADVYRRDEIDTRHFPCFHQMEGVRVFSRLPGSSSPDPFVRDASLSVTSRLGLRVDPVLRAEVLALQQRLSHDPPPLPGILVKGLATIYQGSHGLVLEQVAWCARHLQLSLETMIRAVFPDPELQFRWIATEFPFTLPSWEVEILYRGQWLEVCGCGIIQDPLLTVHARRPQSIGWAFGLGLERLAMVLFDVPDIRLFWSQDPRFVCQFSRDRFPLAGTSSPSSPPPFPKFRPFSKFPATDRDISFWLPQSVSQVAVNQLEFNDNDFYELVREVTGDCVEQVSLVDQFTHPKSGRQSKCFRITYRAMDRTLLNDEVNRVQQRLIDQVRFKWNVELR